MTFQGDPFRTLGIAPGASLNEIKSAYRRLAKQYHPDAAGERALPRFLAIQAAYERLVDGEGRLRATAPGFGRGSPGRAQPSSRAASGGPGASRDAWRARQAGTTASGGRAGWRDSGGANADRGGGPGGGRSRTAGGGRDSSGAETTGRARADDRRDRPYRERYARRGPRKATPGSTTYDEAAEPLDPEWDGGAWYGPSSGTYWTINPREYADPRKHGPEYQARARRGGAAPREADEAARAGRPGWPPGARRAGRGPAGAGDPYDAPAPPPSTDASDAAPSWSWTGDDGSSTTGGAHWGTGGWRYDDMPPEERPDVRDRSSRAAPLPVDDEPLPDLEAIARRFAPRHLLELAHGSDRRWLLALALTGWPPIGYAVGTLIGELSGCASFSPSCPEPVAMVPIVVQPLVVVALALVPPAAAVTAFAGIVALAVALPVAAVLSVGSLPESRVGAPVLGAVVAVAYLVALAWGAHAVWRAPEAAGSPDGPP